MIANCAMAISTDVCVLNVIICIPILHASKVFINTIAKKVANNNVLDFFHKGCIFDKYS